MSKNIEHRRDQADGLCIDVLKLSLCTDSSIWDEVMPSDYEHALLAVHVKGLKVCSC